VVLCPECETDLDIEEGEMDEGEIVSCPECGTDFEVISTNPLDLRTVSDDDEDEEDEEEEDE
jgi:alpha-aminoadipate carrier protein LysW